MCSALLSVVEVTEDVFYTIFKIILLLFVVFTNFSIFFIFVFECVLLIVLPVCSWCKTFVLKKTFFRTPCLQASFLCSRCHPEWLGHLIVDTVGLVLSDSAKSLRDKCQDEQIVPVDRKGARKKRLNHSESTLA